MAKQRLRISFPDLPARAHPLGDDAIAHVFGGCVNIYNECIGDNHTNNCCPRTINNTGSGRAKLGCIGFSSGTRRICNWVWS